MSSVRSCGCAPYECNCPLFSTEGSNSIPRFRFYSSASAPGSPFEIRCFPKHQALSTYNSKPCLDFLMMLQLTNPKLWKLVVSGSLLPVSTLTSSGVIYYQDDEGSEKIAKDRPVRAWRVCAEGHVGSSGRASGFAESKLETHPCFLPFLHLVEYLRVSLDRRFCALIDLWVLNDDVVWSQGRAGMAARPLLSKASTISQLASLNRNGKHLMPGLRHSAESLRFSFTAVLGS